MSNPQYDTTTTYQAWEIVDNHFRHMPVGSILRVDLREDRPGQTVITYGVYAKGLNKDSQFSLVEGRPMFWSTPSDEYPLGAAGESEQIIYPDEMRMAHNFEDLRFRIIKIGAN